MNTALEMCQDPTPEPQRDLSRRRQMQDRMYAMITNFQTAIIGEGFLIKRVEDERCEYFEVHRRGLPIERVTTPVRVAALFTPETFMLGIPSTR